MTARTASKSPSPVSSNLDWGSLTFPKAPVMAPLAPVKEPKTAPAPTRKPAPPQKDPVHPGERPDPGKSPSPACPPSTCPAP